jgi:hypothetical protein
MIEVFRHTKRDLVIAFVLGCLIEFSIWYPAYNADSDPLTAGQYPWLERLQEPGVRSAYFVWHMLRLRNYPAVAYLASACGFAVLVTLWSAAALAVLWAARFFRLERKFKVALYPLPTTP